MNEESGGFGSGTLQIKAVPAAANSVAIAGIDKDGKSESIFQSYSSNVSK